jgi:phospholipase C
MAVDTALQNLFNIDHIVVLMMENRSFDHMLGYLRNSGMPEVNGLTGQERNLDDRGAPIPVFPFPLDQTAFHEPGKPFDESLDPCHSPECVQQQLSDDNGGFVKNFIEQKNPPAARRDLVMGYYTAEHLPVYDFLARQFCVCDAWFSSIPGDTWPNRVFALSGRPAKRASIDVPLLRQILSWIGLVSNPLAKIPLFDNSAFTRQLKDDQWRWYSYDPATLRAVDARYRDVANPRRENFGFFDRQTLSVITQAIEDPIVDGDSFLDDAANNRLRPVSWIDPNFIDAHVLDPASNDDHPPSDVRAGQALVLDIYDTLTKTAAWNNTVFVITYDEHGGFYDHVSPPSVNDGSGFSTLGVRVPALVIGPRVSGTVCHTQFDHTTLIKTILLRFGQSADFASLGRRVEEAPHLGVVLEASPRNDIAPHGNIQAIMDQWRQQARTTRVLTTTGSSTAPDGAGRPIVLSEFQQEFAALAKELRRWVPAGHP